MNRIIEVIRRAGGAASAAASAARAETEADRAEAAADAISSGVLTDLGITVAASEINASARHRQIAQGSFSGAELVIEIPSDIEGVQLDYWDFVGSVSGQPLKLAVGSGTIGSPSWGANHASQGVNVNATTVTGYSASGVASLDVSGNQISSGQASGTLVMNGFNASGIVSGFGLSRADLTGPVLLTSHGSIRETSAVVHTLLRLFVASGTMGGKYRIYGFKKP